MMYRIIDKNTGIFIRDDFTYDETTEIALDVAPAQGFILPKWDGEKWVEGMTQAEIDALPKPTTEPTIEEKVATHDQKIATLEEVVEVIYG